MMWIVYGHHLVQNCLLLVFFLFSFGYSFHVRTCMTTISGDDEEIILANNNVYAQITKYRTQFVPFNKYKIIFYSSPSLWSHIWSISLWIRSLFTHQIKKIWNKKKKIAKNGIDSTIVELMVSYNFKSHSISAQAIFHNGTARRDPAPNIENVE